MLSTALLALTAATLVGCLDDTYYSPSESQMAGMTGAMGVWYPFAGTNGIAVFSAVVPN